jgi:hypothetical protein
MSLYRILKAWVEGEVTWNRASTATAWGTVGCANTTNDRESTAIASVLLVATGSPSTTTITFDAAGLALLKQMWDGTFTNNGFLVQLSNENNDQTNFYSSNNATPENRPKMVITMADGQVFHCPIIAG